MLINYFGKDYYSLKEFLEKKGKVFLITKVYGNYSTYNSISFRKKGNNEDWHTHIAIFSIYSLSLEYYESLQESLRDTVRGSLCSIDKMYYYIKYQYNGYADNCIFLLNLFHTTQVDSGIFDKLEPLNSHALLLKLRLSYNSKESNKHICSILQQKIEEYSQFYNVSQANIKLSLTRLLGFERLKFNSDDLEKYIQSKNEELSCCTEEELNEQAEKFINPNPHYFKSEVFAYLGAAIVKKIDKGVYTKVVDNALGSLNPDTSLQTLQILALAAIGSKFAR